MWRMSQLAWPSVLPQYCLKCNTSLSARGEGAVGGSNPSRGGEDLQAQGIGITNSPNSWFSEIQYAKVTKGETEGPSSSSGNRILIDGPVQCESSNLVGARFRKPNRAIPSPSEISRAAVTRGDWIIRHRSISSEMSDTAAILTGTYLCKPDRPIRSE